MALDAPAAQLIVLPPELRAMARVDNTEALHLEAALSWRKAEVAPVKVGVGEGGQCLLDALPVPQHQPATLSHVIEVRGVVRGGVGEVNLGRDGCTDVKRAGNTHARVHGQGHVGADV